MDENIIFDVKENDKEGTRAAIWQEALRRANACKLCELCNKRHSVVFGDGDRFSKLLFIGEGPGADEDEQGIPFVGKAGMLLTQILTAAGIDRKEVYITNTVKCRPPENRVPSPSELSACNIYLQTQIQIINPAIIVLLGSTPAKWILNTTEGITKLRGRWFDYRGIATMPMFHPSYLLRFPDKSQGSPKHLSWVDIQEVKRQWENVKSNGQLEGVIYG